MSEKLKRQQATSVMEDCGSSIASVDACSSFENAQLTYVMCNEALASNATCYDAMYNLAQLLENGASGVPRNPSRAVELYTKAAEEGGHLYAMHCLAAIHESGKCGVKKNGAHAVQLYKRCIAAGGEDDSMINLANILKEGSDDVAKDPRMSLELYIRAIAEFNSPDALPYLAEFLEDGSAGIRADPQLLQSIYDVLANIRNRTCSEQGRIVKEWYEAHATVECEYNNANNWFAAQVLAHLCSQM